jgi:pimeloyl-ACP methyl ester carboxylesterase
VAILALHGHALAYDTEGEGVPLLFIHQVATDRRLWQHQRQSFSQRYRLVTVDVMGHGEGVCLPQGFSLGQATEQIQELLRRLEAGPAFVIGVSMGAAIAMRLALSDPSLLRGLILISPWNYDASEHTKNLIDRLFRLAEAGDMATHTDLFLRYVFPPAYLERRTTEVEYLRAVVMEQDARVVAYTWAACLASDLTGSLRDIRVPSLVIGGLNDLFTPPYLARAVAEELSEVELEVWEETGHFPFLENPLRFNRRLEMFIRRCLIQSTTE